MALIRDTQHLIAAIVGLIWAVLGIVLIQTPASEWPLFLAAGVYLLFYPYIIAVLERIPVG